MPDTKITALAAITTVDPAADVLPIVDISDTSMAASGTTKKITSNQILGAGGTATLASATITGNLTASSNVYVPASTTYKIGPVGSTWGGLRFDSTNQAFLDSDIGLTFRTGGATSFTTSYQIGATGISTWSVGGSTAMTLNSTGLGVGVVPSAGKGALQLSSGINFPATQVASSDANTLDDYEEGTFTPTVIGTTTAGTGTYSNQTGYYTKVGRLVTITVYMNWTAHTGTGNMRFAGLPFTSANLATNYNGISIAFLNNIALTAGNVLYGNIEFGSTQITLVQYPTGGGAYSLVPIDTSAEIAFSATYFV